MKKHLTDIMIISDSVLRNIGVEAHEFLATSLSIDSRNIESGSLFVAIGNGNKFASEAITKGAVAAIIDNPDYAIPGKTILVKNSLVFLKTFGKFAKDSACFDKTIGITGSVGKTTTRTWINSVLSNTHKSFSSIKNYNTIYGLPLSLSLVDGEYNYGVFEFGSNKPGEISELSNYVEPNLGIITNIYESHIGQFKGIDELANEKVSIIDGLKRGGTLVFDGDSKFRNLIEKAASTKDLQMISVGFDKSSDFYIRSCNKNEVVIKSPLGEFAYRLNCSGRQYIYISAILLATLSSLGLDIQNYLDFMGELKPLSGRGEILNFEKFSIIDDSYNASPSSMAAALDRLSAIDAESKIAILGEMKELGDHSAHFHEQIARKLANIELDHVFFVGSKDLWPVLNTSINVTCFEELDNISIEKILKIVQNKSIILLKGSRSIGLEKFIDHIRRICSTI